MGTLHIKGWAEKIVLTEQFSDNYDLPNHDFDFDEESSNSFKAFIRIYSSGEEITLDEAVERFVEKLCGKILMVGQAVGYSEYTITGFEVHSAKFGGHDLNQILDTYKKRGDYVHILIDEIE